MNFIAKNRVNHFLVIIALASMIALISVGIKLDLRLFWKFLGGALTFFLALDYFIFFRAMIIAELLSRKWNSTWVEVFEGIIYLGIYKIDPQIKRRAFIALKQRKKLRLNSKQRCWG